MTRKIRIAFILTSVVLVIIALSLAGVSFAVWTISGGIGESNNSVSPSVIADDEYVWAKYFNYEKYTVQIGGTDTNVAAVTTFYGDGAGINLEDVIIPAMFREENINGEGFTVYTTYRITNQVFMDSTLKKLPVTIYIPSTVREIDAGAFSNLPNLERVVFLGGAELEECVLSEFVFAGCQNLRSVEGDRRLNISSTSFLGCAYQP